MAIATIMRIHTAGVQFMRDNPERFIGSTTENSWLRHLNDMCIQGTWADALITGPGQIPRSGPSYICCTT